MSKGDEVLVPETRVLVIDGEDVTITKLGIKQLIELGRVVMSTLQTFGEVSDKKLLSRMMAGQTTIAEDLFALVEALDEDHLAWLFSVLTKKDRAWCIEHVGVDEALDILDALQDVQDLGELWGKVQRLIQKMRKKQT